jgi:serine/threonine protein kinase
MTKLESDRLEVLFDQAVALPVEAREAFLDTACRNDAALRAELESLLKCDASTQRGGLLSKSPLVRTPQPATGRGAAPERSGQAQRFDPPAAPDEIGVLGPYRIVAELGRGGMGTVYSAVDTRLGRQVALKVLLPQYSADSASRQRFLREARAAAQVVHDNVVTVYACDEHDGISYIAMQLLDGCSLDDYLKQQRVLSLTTILRIAREAAAGLAAAHEAGLVHRDIKPANLWLVSPSGRVKILDFGLAKPADSAMELTFHGAILGTPAYMSPEQARGGKLDPRSDVFSLGAVLYRLAAGQLPFAGPNTIAALTALAIAEPMPLRELNRAVPESLATLIHQMLAKRPDERPSSAAEVVKRLDEISESDCTTAESAAPHFRRPKPQLAKRSVWIAAGAALLLIVVAFVIGPEIGSQSHGLPQVARDSMVTPASSNSRDEPDSKSIEPGRVRRTGGSDADRRAAQWVLSAGGFVRTNHDREAKTAAQLPSIPFFVTQVDFSGISFRDTELNHLAGLRLTHLNLHATPVTDAGLAQLTALDEVKYLNLQRTSVTDDGLAYLKQLRGLDWLYLSGTAVTNAGLVHLKDLQALRIVHLDDLKITDAGLVHLKPLKSLTYLNVRKTGITAQGLREFHDAVPACKIEHDEGLLRPIEVDRAAAR